MRGEIGLFFFLFWLSATPQEVLGKDPTTSANPGKKKSPAVSASPSTPSAMSPLSSPPAESAMEAEVKGFRSAHFGMTEKEVLQVIQNDFQIPESQVLHDVHPLEKTAVLTLAVPNLISDAGPAQVSYIFGYKSKTLIHVNVLWGNPVSQKVEPRNLVGAANQLRNYFVQQGFATDKMAVNVPLPDGSIIVFRGLDKKGRMALLLLNQKLPSGERTQADAESDLWLKLSYMENPASPDIFRIKKGDF